MIWDDIQARSRAAAERWNEKYAQRSRPSIEELQRQGREAWLKLRQEREAAQEQERELARDIGDDFEP